MQVSVFGSAVLFLLTHKEHTLSHSHTASLARSLLPPFFSPFDFSFFISILSFVHVVFGVSPLTRHTRTQDCCTHTYAQTRSDTHTYTYTHTHRKRNTWILSSSFLFALLSLTRALTHRPKPGHTHIDTHTRALALFSHKSAIARHPHALL